MSWLLWCYQLLVCLQLVLLHSLSFANLCSHDESSALLHFKQHFSFDNDSFVDCDYTKRTCFPILTSWDKDTDCCSWDGVTCDMVTGHVIGLDLSSSWLHGSFPSNSSLFLLSHLQNLNLAFNSFNLSQIPSDFVQFQNLTHLNLSSSSFSGQVPFEISRLSKLISLDLSDQGGNGELTLEPLVMERLVQNLTELEELNLNYVNMSTVVLGLLTNLSSSLRLLSLRDCELQGSLPENIFHLPNLHTLDLQNNYDLNGVFPKGNWSGPLNYLDISSTNFTGILPDSIENLKFLSYLDMVNCSFFGLVPASIGNLTKLSYLNLGENNFFGHIPSHLSKLEQLVELKLFSNHFSGEIPDIFINLTQLSVLELTSNELSGAIPTINLTQLSVLDLASNELSGAIPTSVVSGLQNLAYICLDGNSLGGTIPFGIFNLPSLRTIYLRDNQLTGRIDEFQSNSSLEKIDLTNNRLHGPIPTSIFDLVSLTYLALSSNNLSGTVELYMFAKFVNLRKLLLSNNNLSLTTTTKINSTFPKLVKFGLSSCNINEFPKIISTATTLLELDLSNNNIHGQIPNWLFNISTLGILNLSHNYVTGIGQLPWSDLDLLDLRFNLLQGMLPAPPSLMRFFFVSHNKFTGVIPSSFCNLSSIEYLDLSSNSLSGVIPECLGNSKTLLVMDLKMNNFHGTIPQTFAYGSQLMTLNLNGNRLEGSLPPSLANCGNLEVLDVGNNMINDTFPHWLAALPQLHVLILRSNRFHGPLVNSRTRLLFSKLRILDLSHNGFSGPLPTRFFGDFEAMMNGRNNSAEMRYMGDDYYQDSVMLTMKGVQIEMEKILTIFTTIDLSGNKFQGRIPDVIGKLNSLKVLNFSHNNLIGHIPVCLENLTELESLDLSSNRLEGEIPTQLTSLTSLSVLNLSYNHLVGSIPMGKQFNTFQNDSYLGNSGLCGLPMSEKCSNGEAPKSDPTKFQEEQDTWSWFDWKIIMMGYGSGLVIGLSMGYIVFSTGKPWWFVSMVERKVIKVIGSRRRRRN